MSDTTPEPNAVPEAPPPPPMPDRGRRYDVDTKRPFLAAFLSLMPGMGNVYNGLYLRGVIFFLIAVSLIGVAARGYPLVGFAIAFFWLFNVIDAYRQATLINYGYAQDLGLTDLPKEITPGQGGVLAGGLLFAIGLFAALEEFVRIDLDWLFDLWPFVLMAIGGWVAWASIRDRKKQLASETASGYDD